MQPLRLHPESVCAAVTRIDVNVLRERHGRLVLSYTVFGAIGDLRLPATTAPARGNELWRHTCFEAFVRAASDTGYYEFNLSPSTEWAAYRFDGYRSGMRVAAEAVAPRIEVRATPDRYALEATLDLRALSDLPHDATWRLGLSAVIEEKNGNISYWALAHPPGKPDFHHSDCFALEISPA